MDREAIAQIIRGCGYSPRFRDRVGRKGNGVSWCQVSAVAPNRERGLGGLSDLEAMSEEQLKEHIKTKFAPPPVTETMSGKEFMDILMGKES